MKSSLLKDEKTTKIERAKEIGNVIMALYIIGDFLKETRQRKGYTQEEVSFGICTTASLSRIENGVQTPSRYMLDKLLERLGMENNVFNIFVNKDEMEFYETMQTMSRNITDGDMVELEKQIKRLEKMTKNSTEIEKQSWFWAKGVLLQKQGGSTEEVMELFMRAIHITLPIFDGKTPLKNNLLTFDEIIIINSIAILYAKDGKMSEAMKIGYWLMDYMEERMCDGKMKMKKYPAIVYDLSNWLGKTGRFQDALEVTEKGINYCIKYGNLVALPLLLFNKACSLAELNEKEQAKEYFTQSIVVFQTMMKYDRAQMAIDCCKNQYGIEI